MTVKELITKLQKYPENMKVWVSDNGYCEGGIPLDKVEKVMALNVYLDGDEVNNEYLYTEDLTESQVKKYLKKGYFLSNDETQLSKEIIYLNDI